MTTPAGGVVADRGDPCLLLRPGTRARERDEQDGGGKRGDRVFMSVGCFMVR